MAGEVTVGSGEQLGALRSADAPFRALVEQMQEGAVTLTIGGDIIYCNRRFSELVHLPRGEVVGGPFDRFVIDAHERETLRTLIVYGAGKLRTNLVRAGDTPVEAHISVSGLTVDGVEHRSLLITDMSTLLKVQRESKTKDEFLAVLAHELRNPLGAIGGAARVLDVVDLVEPRAVRARGIIQRQVTHMARLINDLLDVGRAITGKITIERQPLDLAEVVRSCVSGTLSLQGDDGRVEVSTEPVWVLADAVRLEQIACNLLSNALKFSPANRRVRVAVVREGSEAVLQVSDEGIGIDSELLPRVFDLFVQAADTSDHPRGGLGIGLTLVRRLVELHGGTIDVTSQGLGHGAMFTMRMPAIAGAPSKPAAEPAAKAKPRSRRVLLVDDNVDSREMYGLILQADGHVVFQAADGDDALSMFRRMRPEVAVVDIGLPGMDGYEVARRIRADPQGHDIKLIALTGYGQPEDRERSRAAGFDRHLVKPASPDAIRNELDA
jgi:signal transduction histidine kinase/CheY-like chemotaxis protein